MKHNKRKRLWKRKPKKNSINSINTYTYIFVYNNFNSSNNKRKYNNNKIAIIKLFTMCPLKKQQKNLKKIMADFKQKHIPSLIYIHTQVHFLFHLFSFTLISGLCDSIKNGRLFYLPFLNGAQVHTRTFL